MTSAQGVTGGTALAPAFTEPVTDAARTFRAILTAMAEPGKVLPLPSTVGTPPPMHPAMTATLLTLCDTDTPVSFAPDLASDAVRAFVAFHTGAPIVAVFDAAFHFAVSPLTNLPLDDFQQGKQDYPDRSATLVIEVDYLAPGSGARLTGPGIAGVARLGCPLFTPAFCEAWRCNNARFPRGVDLILTAQDTLAALPRTTRLHTHEEA
ncbi:MAG: phosphonate C-P lyase system protein PhnH [Pseudomonadota bacterium]